MNPVIEQIIPWLVGALGVPLVNALKDALKLEGKQAVVLAAVVAFVLAVASLAVAGFFGGDVFAIENLASTFGVVLAASQLAYKLLSN